jgi:hypothetical protein
MRIASWTPKATNTLSEYVILIAFLQQQWLHERLSMLRNMHIAPIVESDHFCLLITRCRGILLGLKGLNDTQLAGLPRTRDRLVAETST